MKKLVLIALTFTATGLYGQQYVDVARIYFSNTPQNKFDGSEATTRVKELGADLTFPIVLNSKLAVLTGVFYEQTETRLFEDQSEQLLTMTGLRAGLSITHSKKWSGSYMVVPKLASDMENVNGRDFQLGVIGLLKYAKHDRLSYKVGAYYNAELFGPLFVPLFGLYYQSPDKKFESNLTLPFQADANYALHKRINAGMNFNGQVRSFKLSELPESGNEGYAVKASNELFTYLRFNLTDGLFLQVKAGYTLGRSYRVFEAGDKVSFASVLIRVGDDRTQLNTDFSDGFVYQLNLVYRVSTNKKG